MTGELSAYVSFQVQQQLQSLGYGVNATALYYEESHRLSAQVVSGNFTAILQSKAISGNAPLLRHANCTSVEVQPYRVIYLTASPSNSPVTGPVSPSTGTSSGYSSWPVYGQVLLPLALAMLLVAAVISIALCTKTQDNSNLKSMIYSDRYKPGPPDSNDKASVIVDKVRDVEADEQRLRAVEKTALNFSDDDDRPVAGARAAEERTPSVPRSPAGRSLFTPSSAETHSRASGRKHRRRQRDGSPTQSALTSNSKKGSVTTDRGRKDFISGDFL